MEIKEQVKNAVSIVDVASLYLELKPSGKNYKALCPFHHEKTPSFYVMPDKGTFTCYGCHAYGDIFTLVQQQEGLTFPQALKFLIERFHLPFSPSGKRPQEPGQQYERINELAQQFFKQQLWDSPEGKQARDYLDRRGISEETMRTFAIGLAPNHWDGLRTFLEKQNVSARQGVEMGLLVSSDQGSYYDRFRNRIIVPILSMNGKLMAFGGRALDDQPAKYINSPETPLYKKGQHLFAFNLVRQQIREQGCMVLVEGYFDQIALYQYGIRNAVASLGTALTDEQAYLIKRFTDKVYICYDSDAAGQKATVSAVEKLLTHHVSTRVIQLNAGKDPDEFVRKKGPEAFREQLKQSVEGFGYLLQRLAESIDLADPLSKSKALQTLGPVVQKVDDRLIRLDLIRKCEDFFNLPFEEVNRQFSSAAGQKPLPADPPPAVPTLAEADFLKTLLAAPERIADLRTLLEEDLLASLSIGKILKTMLQSSGEDKAIVADPIAFTSQLIERLNGPDRQLVQRLTEQLPAATPTSPCAEQTLENCMLLFVERLNKKRIELLNRQIHMAEQNGNKPQIHELMQRKNQFIKTIRDKNHTTPRSSPEAVRRS